MYKSKRTPIKNHGNEILDELKTKVKMRKIIDKQVRFIKIIEITSSQLHIKRQDI